MSPSLNIYMLLLLCCFLLAINLTNCSSNFTQPLCHADESSALLQFKHGFVINKRASGDPFAYPKVESWKLDGKSSDCCLWDGVECDQDTGHVIGLDLSSSFLYGFINSNSSLFSLAHLRRLNLADNCFNLSQIPSEFGHLSRLRSLNISNSSFFGQIPSEISRLPKLTFLDLSNNFWFAKSFLKLEKPSLSELVQNLTKLKVLNLDWVNISSTVPVALSNMSSLMTLALQNCQLYGEFPSSIFQLPNLRILKVRFNGNLIGYLPEFHRGSPLVKLGLGATSFSGTIPDSIGNLKSLSILILRACNFSGTLPSSLGNLAHLTILDLTINKFWGQIPPSLANVSQLSILLLGNNNFDIGTTPLPLGKLTKLEFLFLTGLKIGGAIPDSLANLTLLSILSINENELVGRVPAWLMNLTRLTYLDLSFNQLQGSIPSSISQLQHLESLSLGMNNLSGEVELDMFLNFQNLTRLQLSLNKLTLVSKNRSTNATIPKFNILGLSSCNSREFPYFLRYQDKLELFLFSDNKIHGEIPTWLWNTTKETMEAIDLSHNFLTGFEQHPYLNIPWKHLSFLDLSFNRLQGSLPIPPPSTVVYKVAGNSLGGEIPPSICLNRFLGTLDVSDNKLNGTIPQCLLSSSTESLLVLNLSVNNFHGTIPQTFTRGSKLMMIDLSQNQLQGHVPRSLTNCTMLEVLVLANNQIEGTFPVWLGALPELQVLVLRHNKFHGPIGNPTVNFKFPKLRIIDLSHNSFSGNLPSGYFPNWNAMRMAEKERLAYMYASPGIQVAISATATAEPTSIYCVPVQYLYSITMTIKGTKRLYEKIQMVFVAIDLSNNKFEGEIPESLGTLIGLQVLNISKNNLTGVIPSSLKNLAELESLDLSQNLLSGEIPQQLTQLTFLAVLNVSHNHLTGPIPRGKQFDTFENGSYDGNSGLCGAPLSKLCGSLPPPAPPHSQSDEDNKFPSRVYWIVISLGYGGGLIVGLVIGNTLTTKYHEWFVETFGRKKQTKRRKGRRN